MKLSKQIILGVALMSATTMDAQNTNSGYFLDNYTYRYELNPAFGNTRGFFSMPAVGNINASLNANLHLEHLVYNLNGKTVLFTNPGIDASTVLDKIPNRSKLSFNSKVNLFSFGFKGFGGYNTVTTALRADANMVIPKAFFELAKEGISNRTYDIQDLYFGGSVMGEVALNHSHQINKNLRIGATAKLLLGGANVDVQLNEANLTLGEDNWIARTNADVYASVTGMKFKTSEYVPTDPKEPKREYVSDLEHDGSYGPNGKGVAFDLGLEYKWKDLSFSAAVLDMGLMTWGKTQWASTDGTQTVETDAYTFSLDNDADNSFGNEMDRLTDNMSKLYQLKDMGEIANHQTNLAPVLNVGVDYALSFYRKMHVGLLYTNRFAGKWANEEYRLSLNYAPAKFFSANVNATRGTYGEGIGWLINFYVPGMNLFLGMDNVPMRLSRQYVPLRSNAAFNIGMNIPL